MEKGKKMELNREQIIKALEHWTKNFDGKVTNFKTLCEALLLIKELTEENKAWQMQVISHQEKSDKAYYDLACEVENLRAENERLREQNKRYAELEEGCYVTDYKNIKADTVREMQEIIKTRMNNFARKGCGEHTYYLISKSVIDQIAKEIIGET